MSYTLTVEVPYELVAQIEKPLREEIRRLNEENQKLIDGSAEPTVAKLRERIKELEARESLVYGSFSSEKELKAYKAFSKKHAKCRSMHVNAGKYPYVIENYVGVGVCREVVCPVCNEKKDITDLKAW